MRSEEQIAAEADVMQANSYAEQFAADRENLAVHRAKYFSDMNEAQRLGESGLASIARRAINEVDTDIRKIDRMLDALQQRFPGSVTR